MLIETFILDGVDVGTSASMMLDSIAAAARPAQSFLRGRWYGAASPEAQGVGIRRPSGEPLAAIPTVRRGIGPFAVNEVPGCYWPYRSFPVAEETSEAELQEMLRHKQVRRQLGRIWRMGPVYGDDAGARRLIEAAEGAEWTVLRRSLGTCFELDLAALRADGPWPRPSTLRKNRWRENRLAADFGPIDYRFRTGADWTQEDRDAMAAIEANSWLAGLPTGGDTKFQAGQSRRVWERLVDDPVLANMLFCSLLTIGGIPAAFTFGLEVGKVRYTIANNYDERFARHGPGKLLLYKDFERAAERGVERISWGSGDAGYKSEMGAQPGPEILDLLFVRSRLLGSLLRPIWSGLR